MSSSSGRHPLRATSANQHPCLVERMCRSLGTGVEGVFIPLIPFHVVAGDGQGPAGPKRRHVPRTNAIMKIVPPEGSRVVLDTLSRSLGGRQGMEV